MIKKAFITGATSGIGEALARLMADQGIDLFITGRNQEQLKRLSNALSGDILVNEASVDLANPEDRKILLAKMREFQPDLVINNAGFGLYGEIFEHSTALQLQMIEVNVAALTEITIETVKMFKEECKKGVILNVSSVAGFYVFPCFSVYAATKAYVTRFSEAVDTEVKPHGIRVLTACPGQVDTHFRERAAKGKKGKNAFGVMSVSFAAEQIWKQIIARKPVSIFDWKYRLTLFLARMIPNAVLTKVLKKQIKSRY